MADDFQILNASGTGIWMRATEVNDGSGNRYLVHHIARGQLAQGVVGTSAAGVKLAAIRRAIVASLPEADGTIADLITDDSGRLRVTLQGTSAQQVQPYAGFEVQTAEIYGTVYTEAGVALTTTPFYAEVAGGSTNQSIVAAVTSKKIVVTSLSETVGAAQTTVTWVSKPGGAGSTIDKRAWDAYGGRALAPNRFGWLETVAGEALCLTTVGDTTYVRGTYVAI